MIDAVVDVEAAIEAYEHYVSREEELYEQTYGGIDSVEEPEDEVS